MSAPTVVVLVVAGLASVPVVLWFLCVPKGPVPAVRPVGPERPGPPVRPLGIPLAAAVIDRLVRCGMTPGEVHAWWGRARRELADATPRQAALSGCGRLVLELAERDAAACSPSGELGVSA